MNQDKMSDNKEETSTPIKTKGELFTEAYNRIADVYSAIKAAIEWESYGNKKMIMQKWNTSLQHSLDLLREVYKKKTE